MVSGFPVSIKSVSYTHLDVYKRQEIVSLTVDHNDHREIPDFNFADRLCPDVYKRQRMIEALQRGEELPIDIKDSTIYYMGPSPAREGRPIGSAGPTTATRMDRYAPTLLDLGEKAMIGKGKRSKEVIDAIVRNHAAVSYTHLAVIFTCCIDKARMTFMQISHGRNKPDRIPFFFPFFYLFSHFIYG